MADQKEECAECSKDEAMSGKKRRKYMEFRYGNARNWERRKGRSACKKVGMPDRKRHEKDKAGGRGNAFFAAMALGCFCMALPSALIPCRNVTAGYAAEAVNRKSGSPDETESIQENDGRGDNRKRKKVSERGDRIGGLPGSEFFRQAAGNIWQKDYRSITAEEYAELTSIQIDTSEKTVSFQLNEGMVQTMSYREKTEMDTADLAVFTGLEWISVDRKLNPGDLQGLDRLFGVYAQNTVKEMAEIIPDPETITELGIADEITAQAKPGSKEGTGEKNLDGIERFPNLLYLSVDYRELEDISALLNISALQGLMLEECDLLRDYSPLASLENLQWLKIASDSLESIDFIGSMRHLTSLSIEGSRVKSLDVLKECAGLTLLNLTGNSMIEDYSVIGQLSGLEELTLEMGHGGKLPSFEKLKRLERLSLKDVDDLSPLKDARNVISLILDHCSGARLEAVSSMADLDTLEVHRFSTTVESLSPLTKLSELTTLHLRDVVVSGNIEEIFGIPSLENLYLDKCRVGLDFAQLPVNENLEVLSMNGIRIANDPVEKDMGKDTEDRAEENMEKDAEEGAGESTEEIRLSEHYEIFDCFPNLTELYFRAMGLENIAFVEKLPHLQHLDIRDNPVTSLKELRKLEEIRTVWYGGGTIVFP